MRLSTVAALAMGMVVIAAVASRTDGASDKRAYSVQSCVLQIDKEAIDVRHVEGGDARGEAVTEGNTGKKHIGKVTFQPLRAHIAPDEFTKFIADSLAGSAKPVSGSVQYTDFDRKVQQQLDFQNAVLTELTVPELSAENKTGGDLIIGLQPESSRMNKGSGAAAAGGMKGGKNARKWAGGFSMSIPGMNTSRVRKIESFTLRRGGAEGAVGETRTYEKSPATWQVPNLVFYIAAQDADKFQTWFEDFVVKGSNDDSAEKTMDIELLDASMKGSLLTLQCSGVGIVSCALEPADAGSGQMGSVRVEVYVEKITIPSGGAAKNAAAAPAPPPPEAPAAAPAPAAAAPAEAAKTAEPAPAAVKARKKKPAAPAATPAPAPQ